jgi:peptidoglycan/xylan/chitin deacetylase (PgdA/CDA1 family)
MHQSAPTNARKTAVAVLLLTIIWLFFNWRLAWIPPALLLIVCLTAPFCYRYGFFLPIISRGRQDAHAVALTFDDGPDPMTTPHLLKLLQGHGVKATFFVTGRRARAFPELMGAILAAGHTLGNHSYHHNSCLLLKGKNALYRDIALTQRILTRLGATPKVYRPPVGITAPPLRDVLSLLQLKTVNFSCRAMDRGNYNVDVIARRILKKVRTGDIIMLHDLQPSHGIPVSRWVAEVDAVISGLAARGLTVLPLAELIGETVHTESAVDK